VNLILPLLQEGQIDVCLAERVPLLVLFWGDPRPYVAEAHRHATKIFIQWALSRKPRQPPRRASMRSSSKELKQGPCEEPHCSVNPRGRRWSKRSPLCLCSPLGVLPQARRGSSPQSGAQAVSMGTRFLCSTEAYVTSAYKERVVRSTAQDTVYTTLFDLGWPDAPHRVLRNTAFVEWEAAGRPAVGSVRGRAQSSAPPLWLVPSWRCRNME